MSNGSVEMMSAPSEVDGIPLAELNPAQSALFQADTMWPYFERLRREDPIHFTPEGDQAAHWAVTRYNDIMAVETNHEVFSSVGGITLPPSEARARRMLAEGGGPGGGMVRRAGRRKAVPACSSPWTRPSTTCNARR